MDPEVAAHPVADSTAVVVVAEDVVVVAGSDVVRRHRPTPGAHGPCRGRDLGRLSRPRQAAGTVLARRTHVVGRGVLHLRDAEEVDVTAAAVVVTLIDGAV